MCDPLSNKERPRKAHNSPNERDGNEAVSGKHSISLNKVVEANRRRLHKPESDKTETELEAYPSGRRRVLRYETEYERAACGEEKCGKSGNKTRFGLGETVGIFLCETFGCEVGNEVGVDLDAC